MIRLEFNSLPISINKLYINIPKQARRFKSAEGKQYTTTITEQVKKQINTEILFDALSKLQTKKLNVTIYLESSKWLLKDKKTIAKKDAANMEKVITDSIFATFKELGFSLDDSQIFSQTIVKIVSVEEKTIYLISELE